MKLKNLKRVSAVALSLTLALTAVPAISTLAATKPTISKSASTTISGVKTLKITKGGYKISSVKVKSSKTSVVKVKGTKSAVTVYGIGSGSAKVTATVVGTKAGKAKTFKLTSSVKVAAPTGYLEAETLSEGGTTNAYVSNIPAKATVEYISSAPSVAFVGEDGLVRAVSGGNATIQAEITFPKTAMAKKTKKTITLGNLKVNENATSVVGNQAVLLNALSRNYSAASFPNGKDITLKTTSSAPITIPASASNWNVNLIVDAPNATITNFAGFRHLTINSVAMYTWKENYQGRNQITLANTSEINLEVGNGARPEIYAWSVAKSTINVENGGVAYVNTKAAAAAPKVVMKDGGDAYTYGDGSVEIDLSKTTDNTAWVHLENKGAVSVISSSTNSANTNTIVDNETGKAVTETIVAPNGSTTTKTIANETKSDFGALEITKSGNVYTANLSGAPAGVEYSWKWATNNRVEYYDSGDLNDFGSEATASGNKLTLNTNISSGRYAYVIVSATGYNTKISPATAELVYTLTNEEKASVDAEALSLNFNDASKRITGAVVTGRTNSSSISWTVSDSVVDSDKSQFGATNSVIGGHNTTDEEFAAPVAAGVGIIKATATLSGSSVSKYWIVTSDGTDYTSITAIDEDDVDERHSFYTSTNVRISYPAATGSASDTKAVTETKTGFSTATFGSYASSNASAATVDAADGTITLVADGTTVISANVTYNGWVRSVSVSVTVDVE